MALRDKLRARTQPLLDPGEQIQAVFLAQSGPSPYWFFLTYLVMFWIKYRIVVATDRAIVIFNSGLWAPAKPKALWVRLPRNVKLGPLSGLWGKLTLNGIRHWIHKRFHKDVAAANALVTGA